MGSSEWDLVIVGSGPAGCAAAIGALSANPSATVLLVDRHRFPRDKCCGDAVSEAALTELANYGVDRSRVAGDFRPVDSMRIISPGGFTVSRRLPCALTIVPRVVFDASLRSVAEEAGAVWMQHNVRRIREEETHVQIDDAFRAGVVIGADGVESVVRRSLNGSPDRQIAIAIRGYGRNTGDDVPTMRLDGRRGLAYAWRFPIGDTRANVGYGHQLTPGETASRAALIARMHTLLPGVEIETSTLRAHRLPLSTSREIVARRRILLAGDAASLVNPISGEGIYYAVASGLAAGVASAQGPRAGDCYRAALRRRLERHHRHVALLASLIRSKRVLEAGLRAASSSQRAFDDISALGLGEGRLTGRLIAGIAGELLRSNGPRLAT